MDLHPKDGRFFGEQSPPQGKELAENMAPSPSREDVAAHLLKSPLDAYATISIMWIDKVRYSEAIMNVSKKCQYALRAVLELARVGREETVTSRRIAKAESIPPNFLELILKELRQAGWIDSSRGPNGGYCLAVSPDQLSVGEVIRFIDGPLAPVKCMAGSNGHECAAEDRCAFAGLWDRAEQVLSELYDNTTFQDILDEHETMATPSASLYQI
jgi:Rrf2 family protein